jgi:hypothetical protein
MNYRFRTTTTLFATIVFATLFVTLSQTTYAQPEVSTNQVVEMCPCFTKEDISGNIEIQVSSNIVVDGHKTHGEWNEDWAFARITSRVSDGIGTSPYWPVRHINLGSSWNYEARCHQCFIKYTGERFRDLNSIALNITAEQHNECLSQIFKAAVEATGCDL